MEESRSQRSSAQASRACHGAVAALEELNVLQHEVYCVQVVPLFPFYWTLVWSVCSWSCNSRSSSDLAYRTISLTTLENSFEACQCCGYCSVFFTAEFGMSVLEITNSLFFYTPPPLFFLMLVSQTQEVILWGCFFKDIF